MSECEGRHRDGEEEATRGKTRLSIRGSQVHAPLPLVSLDIYGIIRIDLRRYRWRAVARSAKRFNEDMY